MINKNLIRKSIKENFRNRLTLVPKLKYREGYFDASEELIERLEEEGYDDIETILLAPSRLNKPSDVRRLKQLINAIFSVYPRDERENDGFREVDVFVFDIDQEDYEDFNRDIERGLRTPVYRAFDLNVVENHIGDIDKDLHLDESKPNRLRRYRKHEHVKTDYEGGFTDLLKEIDVLLEKYFEDYQVEIIVTDNGFATITVFSKKDNASTVSVELSYSKGKAKVSSDNNKSITVDVDVDKDDYDELSDAIIELVEKDLKKNESFLRRRIRRI